MKHFVLAALAALSLTSPADAFQRHSFGHASHGYYTSSDGYRVHGPDYNRHNVSAHCRDGMLSHSRHHRGTCSFHGGVAHWG
jgi:Protein of unknown function (DUF3761)